MGQNIQPFDVRDLDDIGQRWLRWSKRLGRLIRIKKIVVEDEKINYLFYFGGEGIEDAYSENAATGDKYEDIITKLTACSTQRQVFN